MASMGVMYERLGEILYERWRGCINKAVERYFYNSLQESRIKYESMEDKIISASEEWLHSFRGITSKGIPIWLAKKRRYKSCYNEVCQPVAPRKQSELYFSDRVCKTEEVVSYAKWRRGKKKLAFIYLGIFWTLEEGETINEAAKRFIYSHQEVKIQFEKLRKHHFWVDEDRIYFYELFKDGALFFHDNKVVMKSESFFYHANISALWAIMAAEGFFKKEGVKELYLIDDVEALGWYRSVITEESK